MDDTEEGAPSPNAAGRPSQIDEAPLNWSFPPAGWKYLGRIPIAEVSPELQHAIDHLWFRLGQDLKDLLRDVTHFATPVTTTEMARWTGRDPASLSRRLLLLTATLEAVQGQFPASSDVFEIQPESYGASRWLMSREAAEAIVCKVLADEQDPNSPTQPPPWRQQIPPDT